MPANAADIDLCHKLAYSASHCIMAGYIDFSIGLVRNYPVMIPMSLLVSQSSRMLKRKDHEWQRLIQSTGQSNFLDDDKLCIYFGREKDRDIMRKE